MGKKEKEGNDSGVGEVAVIHKEELPSLPEEAEDPEGVAKGGKAEVHLGEAAWLGRGGVGE